MKASLHTVLPGYDRTPLFLRQWHPPDGPARATVLLVHGYAEHSGRYEPLAGWLSRHDITLVGFDLRGHGRSGGASVFVHSFDEYVADLHCAVRYARRHTAAPLFLMGHSMGGAVVLLYCLDHGARPAGLVLSSPLLRLPAPGPLQHASRMIGRLAPALPTIPLEREALSRDASVVQAVAADPLYYTGRIKARTGAEMVRASRRLDAQMHRLSLPFFLFHGTGDRLTDPDGSRDLYSRARSADKTLTLLTGFYHETFNDPGGGRVLAQTAEWIEKRLPN